MLLRFLCRILKDLSPWTPQKKCWTPPQKKNSFRPLPKKNGSGKKKLFLSVHFCLFWYPCFYPHRSRDSSVSPVCRIFSSQINSFDFLGLPGRKGSVAVLIQLLWGGLVIVNSPKGESRSYLPPSISNVLWLD